MAVAQVIPTVEEQLAVVKKAVNLTPDEEQAFRETYARILKSIDSYIPRVGGLRDGPYDETREIDVYVPLVYDDGPNSYQMLANGSVRDLAKRETNSWNFHGSNTSQWLFGFGILFDKRDHRLTLHT